MIMPTTSKRGLKLIRGVMLSSASSYRFRGEKSLLASGSYMLIALKSKFPKRPNIKQKKIINSHYYTLESVVSQTESNDIPRIKQPLVAVV